MPSKNKEIIMYDPGIATTDVEFLRWIFIRLIHVYGENPNADYMIRFRRILDKMKDNKERTELVV